MRIHALLRGTKSINTKHGIQPKLFKSRKITTCKVFCQVSITICINEKIYSTSFFFLSGTDQIQEFCKDFITFTKSPAKLFK